MLCGCVVPKNYLKRGEEGEVRGGFNRTTGERVYVQTTNSTLTLPKQTLDLHYEDGAVAVRQEGPRP